MKHENKIAMHVYKYMCVQYVYANLFCAIVCGMQCFIITQSTRFQSLYSYEFSSRPEFSTFLLVIVKEFPRNVKGVKVPSETFVNLTKGIPSLNIL